jgi:hypothetical protein
LASARQRLDPTTNAGEILEQVLIRVAVPGVWEKRIELLGNDCYRAYGCVWFDGDLNEIADCVALDMVRADVARLLASTRLTPAGRETHVSDLLTAALKAFAAGRLPEARRLAEAADLLDPAGASGHPFVYKFGLLNHVQADQRGDPVSLCPPLRTPRPDVVPVVQQLFIEASESEPSGITVSVVESSCRKAAPARPQPEVPTAHRTDAHDPTFPLPLYKGHPDDGVFYTFSPFTLWKNPAAEKCEDSGAPGFLGSALCVESDTVRGGRRFRCQVQFGPLHLELARNEDGRGHFTIGWSEK